MDATSRRFDWRRWRARRRLRRALKDARHVRNMREDVADPRDLQLLAQAEDGARQALCAEDPGALDAAARRLAESARKLCPPRSHAAWREHVEVLVVAVSVALAFRTYFIQPFKIPTSSMHPTLYGIHYRAAAQAGLTDRWPLKIFKWAIFGEWYTEVRAQRSGVARLQQTHQGYFMLVDGAPHQVYENMTLHVGAGQSVYRGQLLASGIRTAGDHIFVNRLVWHFRRPRRGEIMVFRTTGIDHPQIKKNEHYVKRLVALPGERLAFDPPRLLIDGRPVAIPPVMERIQRSEGQYHGYIDTGEFMEAYPAGVQMGPDDFFACGDNQRNSLDSRYWGAVERRNLVGPTFFIYWPLSRRWGRVD